ncbi:MAG: hypothetical protein JRJ09_04525 [Deltaproteobacteria bacterium]|nr:hypothetical protein [Deltaproteobacteria bacterium]MBW2047776.1 hypothetical protein [Deltaproteobacteria bacterium]MBW2111308.1 hypothetical protein [Deltaproteobacteria bacterium]MBW2352415.1 hypothetical protein [Deltaproteobacteria bacterium]
MGTTYSDSSLWPCQNHYLKLYITVLALSLLPWTCPVNVYAQPLGLGAGEKVQQPQQKVLSSHGGRFVFGQISGSAKDKFMLDTATGRLWRIGESGKLGIYLQPVPYRHGDGKCTALPEEIPAGSAGRSGDRP